MPSPNRLANSISPYLLQHAANPVDWFEWGEEALSRARAEDKPIFLSIGYAACHWCHVMAHHVFENEKVAEALNRTVVSIKVDREERPDVDAQYMLASQLLTGSGGWPLSAFLTPSLEPFFAAGRYFPPKDFLSIVGQVAEVWRTRRVEVMASAGQIAAKMREASAVRMADPIRGDAAEQAVLDMAQRFDEVHGGFAHAPKFPSVPGLRLLLCRAELGDERAGGMLHATLHNMVRGGIHDHLGGGFFRYSTDERWLVPHFEKMLYDQGQLAAIYADAYTLEPDPDYRTAALGISEFVRRELTDPSGGFWASLDADSEGHEGRFYVFTTDEVRAVLGASAAQFMNAYGATDAGNFEDSNVLSLVSHDLPVCALGDERAKLLEARSRRVRPATDDKVVAAWNGLMIDGLAQVHIRFGDEPSLDAARRAADFVLSTLVPRSGLVRCWRANVQELDDKPDRPGSSLAGEPSPSSGPRLGRSGGPAQLSDHAFLVCGLISLSEASGERRYLDSAVRLAEMAVERFWDEPSGGFHDYPAAPDQVVRLKTGEDGAEPSANGAAAEAMLRLAEITGDATWRERANATCDAFGGFANQYPSLFPTLISAATR